jgi:phenylalanyl-tRNA synthetase alpha chain
MKTLEIIKKSFLRDIALIKDLESQEAVRVKYLGRKSELTGIFNSLKNLNAEARKKTGVAANALRKFIEEELDKKNNELRSMNYGSKSEIDVTKPGHKITTGNLHPLSKFEEEIRQIFLSMNFSVVEGPEIEDEYHNFDALNIPANHPAREMWDTFWLKEPQNPKSKIQNPKFRNKSQKLLLRTHTSPVQIRYMEKNNPPFQIVAPGRVFRYEATDASHEINFDQLEGLMVGKNVSLANFKFVVEQFFKKLFKGQEVEFRFRPSYFPFVEPGVEVDIKFKGGEWLEVAGAGMVHKKVFEAVGYNPYEWQGFAFGFGINRLAMIKYKIPDIRLFYENDLRFIKQF